jgi:molybdate-binding protein
MDPILRLQNLDQIKTLLDTRRLTILRLLMIGPATLSQLGDILGEQPAQIRHHLKQLEHVGLVEMTSTRVVRGFVEKYYRSTARAFVFDKIILPAGAEGGMITVMGSHDLALDSLVTQLRRIRHNPLSMLALPVGSLDGLVALRQGLAQVTACHLLDAESGEYNLPFVQHFFPDRAMILVTLAYRDQGLIVAPGNPLGLHSLEDLGREDVTLINRNRGSGTRLWLDQEIKRLKLPMQSLHGYQQEAQTHTAVAEAIDHGQADAGVGLHAAAHRLGLGFVPLFQERFDLVIPQEYLSYPFLQPLFDLLTSNRFRRVVESLGGYETSHTGNVLVP